MTQKQIRQEIARRVSMISIAARQCDLDQYYTLRVFSEQEMNQKAVVDRDYASIQNLKISLKELELFINHHLSVPQVPTEEQESAPVVD